tara:strand:- start:21047 stop:22123 length:1077 start_codon:yes stop_codon:yes gene_type:complete
MNLIIPMAGKSSRFPNMRPKWMLTHPSGNFMVIEAIKSLDLDFYKHIYLVVLREHEEIFKFKKGLCEELEEIGILNKSNFIFLNRATKDQPETVKQAIEIGKIKGPIFIKDSDNHFSCEGKKGNFVCFHDLNNSGLIQPSNKSYISIDRNGFITNIVEKEVISSSYCVGGYSFSSSNDFISYLEGLSKKQNRYISDVIFSMILDGKKFLTKKVENYLDWGTVEDWNRFKRSYATLFLDIDGTLVINSSSHFPPYIGNTKPLKSNIEIINFLYMSGKFQIILTTSRKEKFRKLTEKQLKKEGIPYDKLIMDLFHAKRIIVNDYGPSNPFKSCDAINLKRNSEELKDILKEALGIDYQEI